MDCCDSKDVRITESGLNTCVSCGVVHFNEPNEEELFSTSYNYINKTTIPYTAKNRHLTRIHGWVSYSYYEVRDNDLKNMIADYPIEIKTKDLITNVFLELYNKVKIRGKVKLGLLCYAIYKVHIQKGMDIDIDFWFKYLKITYNNYNNAVSKFENLIIYPRDLNKYIKITDNKIGKNKIILDYNVNSQNNIKKYNSKSLILYTIYQNLNELDLLQDYLQIFQNIRKIEKMQFDST